MRTRHLVLGSFVLLSTAGIIAACGGDDTTNPTNPVDSGTDGTTGTDSSFPSTDSAVPTDANSGDTSTGDGSTGDGGPQRGPVSLNIDPDGGADPASLWWDDAKQILYIADNRNNQIWTWTDSAGFVKFATLPDDPAADDAGDQNVGQIIELADGTLVVPRFGFAKYGAITYVSPDGGKGTVPGIPVAERRIGAAVDSTGQIWTNAFIKPATGPQQGSIQKVDLATGETTFATGLQKPVGMVISGNNILISDQNLNAIFTIPTAAADIGDGGLADGAGYTIYANVPVPDELAFGPNGTLFTCQSKQAADGGSLNVRQIFPDGGYTIFGDASYTEANGIAYDPTNKRIFVADSNGTVVRTIKIVPVD